MIVLILATGSSGDLKSTETHDYQTFLPFIAANEGDREMALFTVDFEEGNLTDFDSTTGIGLSAIAPGLVATVWCMEVDITDATARYGQVSTASDHDQIRAFLSLDPLTIDALVMASGDVFTVLLVEDIFSNNTFRVELGYDSTDGFRVRPGVFTDGATWSNGAWVNVSANEHFVEVEWNASSAPGANDGSIEMWLDVYGTRLGDPFGVADSSVAGVDNNTRLARVFKFGAPAGLDASTSGVLWVDHLEVNGDDTEIGHPGTLAFPTAEGAGRFSVGGRGGTLYKVTNLNNAGAGSLRAACEAAGARIVVFEIGGTIQLTSNININDPYISIYGQTAPSDSGGICLRDWTLRVRTHDVIIQHIRSRPGDTSGAPVADLDGIDMAQNPASDTDADDMLFNVILDHCSASWASDENIGVWNSAPTVSLTKNITIQWCIISEGLYDPGDSRSSMGCILGGNGTDITGKNMSIHHCLFVHNRRRNPLVAAVTYVEIVNNVMHDCPGYVCVLGDSDNEVNYAGNTTGSQYLGYTLLVEPDIDTEDPNDYRDHKIYVADNTGNHYVDDDFQIIGRGWGGTDAASAAQRAAWESVTPIHIANSDLTADARAIAYVDVLDCAGCLVGSRDAVDARVVQDVWDDNTGLIDSQAAVGGWPALAAGTPPTDTDGDGMPNPWEIANGTDPNVPDGNQYDLSTEWTNIEVWVSELGICVRGSSTTSTTTLSTTTLSTTSTSTLSTSTLSTTTTTTVPTYCAALTISYGKITLESLTAAEVADREAIAAAAQGL